MGHSCITWSSIGICTGWVWSRLFTWGGMAFSMTTVYWVFSSLLDKAVIAFTSWSNWFFIKSTSAFDANWFCSTIFQVQYECREINCGLWTKDEWASFGYGLERWYAKWCVDACEFCVLMYEGMNEWMNGRYSGTWIQTFKVRMEDTTSWFPHQGSH